MAKRKTHDRDRPDSPGVEVGLGGILRGLGGLVDKLAELTEAGGELSRSGAIRDSGKAVRGIYGFTVKVGLGREGVTVEPFGNIRREGPAGQPVVQEVREPAIDVFEESDHVLIVAEMPGIAAEDVGLEVEGDLLTIAAVRGEKKYRKEVLLPESFPREKMRVSCTNGVVEVRCVK